MANPEIYYASDSTSYFDAAWRLWTGEEIKFVAKRRFLYPILLAFTPLLPGSVAVGVAVVQHILGLVIIVGVGWIIAQTTRFPNVWVPLGTCMVALWPRMLWYEHVMIAEVWLLAAFVAAVAIALPCGALKDKGRLFWFLIVLAAIVACKPHGRPLCVGNYGRGDHYSRQSLQVGVEKPGSNRFRRADYLYLRKRTARELAIAEFDSSLREDRRRAVLRISRHSPTLRQQRSRRPRKLRCEAV